MEALENLKEIYAHLSLNPTSRNGSTSKIRFPPLCPDSLSKLISEKRRFELQASLFSHLSVPVCVSRSCCECRAAAADKKAITLEILDRSSDYRNGMDELHCHYVGKSNSRI